MLRLLVTHAYIRSRSARRRCIRNSLVTNVFSIHPFSFTVGEAEPWQPSRFLAAPAGPVVDAGCGVGRVTRFLADAGLDISGVDFSTAMIEAARSAHPHLRFDVGSLTRLPSPDHSLAGVVYWYSIIATPPQDLDAVWEELDRTLSSSGRTLVAFQAGQNDLIETPNAYGSATTLELYRHRVDDVVHSLEQAGFDVLVEVRRKAALKYETTPQAMLVAQRRQG